MTKPIKFSQKSTYAQLCVGDWIRLDNYKRPRQIVKLKDGEVTVKLDSKGATMTLQYYKEFTRIFEDLAEAIR
jgi:hypothetical protein